MTEEERRYLEICTSIACIYQDSDVCTHPDSCDIGGNGEFALVCSGTTFPKLCPLEVVPKLPPNLIKIHKICENLRKSLDPEFKICITASYYHPKKPYYAYIRSGYLDLFNDGLPESPKNRDYQPTPTRAINNLLTSFLGKRIIYSKHIPFVEIVSKIYDIDLQGNATEVLEAEK